MSEYEKKVKVAMINKGIATYKELSNILGITQSYMSDIVTGARKATNVRQKINDFLEIEGD